ncbi:MAG: glutamine--tRNA ligase [Rhodothermaceae bacterium]|nr:glutamine--tRNA ligase [Rhodothermaceae bacterium]
MDRTETPKGNFLRDIVAADVAAGTYDGRVVTRFPPEPNGYPHIGHAQSICLNFGLAKSFGGVTNLRYDDTNPEAESQEFADALLDAVRWLGFEPNEVLYASDYFEPLYAWAQDLIRKGLAYVDSQDGDAIRAGRGTVTEAGTPSPYRDRPAEESLRLLEEMKNGEHPDGAHVLRAKVDTEFGPMAHPNMKLRDPIMYRIRRDAEHYRRGTEWAIYPLYDWAHGQGDAIEGITHSVCTLEFDVNRPLYDWYLDAIGIPEPRNHQYEFARFNLDYTVMSKRILRRLVEGGHVDGWDDPRMPTIAGLKRRGVRPQALRSFFDGLGVTKVNGSVEIQQLEYALRDDLNAVAPRVMAVLDPVELVIDGIEGTTWIDAPYWPHDVTPPASAPQSRQLPLGATVWIERDDFSADPPKKWKRMAPGRAVRLRHGPVVECLGAETDADGTVTRIRARLADDAKPTGVIHWVDAEHGLPASFRLIERLFTVPDPASEEDPMATLNPDSLVEQIGWVEPSVAEDPMDTRYQFERTGYFWRDPEDSLPGALVFNQIVALKDTWAPKPDAQTPPAARSQTPTTPTGPRDPASALDADQRETYSALLVHGIGEEEAAVLAADTPLRRLAHAIIDAGADPRAAGALVVHDLRRALDDRDLADSQAEADELAAVLALVEDGTLTRNAVGDAVAGLVDAGGTARAVIAARGLAAVRDADALAPAVEAALAENPGEVARYRAGEQKLFGFFVGQAMRRAGKGADPKAVQGLLREKLTDA